MKNKILVTIALFTVLFILLAQAQEIEKLAA